MTLISKHLLSTHGIQINPLCRWVDAAFGLVVMTSTTVPSPTAGSLMTVGICRYAAYSAECKAHAPWPWTPAGKASATKAPASGKVNVTWDSERQGH